MKFSDKTIIVTGAGGGIGSEIVRLLRDEGATVIATDFSDEAVKKLEAQYKSGQVIAAKHDVRADKDWQNIIKIATNSGRKIDCLINGAGVLKPSYVYQSTSDNVDFHIDVNVKGLMLGCIFASQVMKEQRSGHIINVASLAGVAPIPGISLYSASKFAARGYSLAIANELKEFDVKVTVICPDAVKTPMLDLQVEYEEAALTFSGSESLEAADVARSIVDAIDSNEVEMLIPMYRGLIAKVSNFAPDLSSLLLNPLKSAGLSRQAALKNKR